MLYSQSYTFSSYYLICFHLCLFIPLQYSVVWYKQNSIILLKFSVRKTQCMKLKPIVQLILQLLIVLYVDVTQMNEVMYRFNNRIEVSFCAIMSSCCYKQLCFEAIKLLFVVGLLYTFLSFSLSVHVFSALRCLLLVFFLLLCEIQALQGRQNRSSNTDTVHNSAFYRS